jgi:hypothetical protein
MQKFREALDNRHAFRGKCFGKVLYFGLEDGIQPSSSFACLAPARTGARRVAPRPFVKLLPNSAVLQCECEVSRKLRDATTADVSCGLGHPIPHPWAGSLPAWSCFEKQTGPKAPSVINSARTQQPVPSPWAGSLPAWNCFESRLGRRPRLSSILPEHDIQLLLPGPAPFPAGVV